MKSDFWLFFFVAATAISPNFSSSLFAGSIRKNGDVVEVADGTSDFAAAFVDNQKDGAFFSMGDRIILDSDSVYSDPEAIFVSTDIPQFSIESDMSGAMRTVTIRTDSALFGFESLASTTINLKDVKFLQENELSDGYFRPLTRGDVLTIIGDNVEFDYIGGSPAIDRESVIMDGGRGTINIEAQRNGLVRFMAGVSSNEMIKLYGEGATYLGRNARFFGRVVIENTVVQVELKDRDLTKAVFGFFNGALPEGVVPSGELEFDNGVIKLVGTPNGSSMQLVENGVSTIGTPKIVYGERDISANFDENSGLLELPSASEDESVKGVATVVSVPVLEFNEDVRVISNQMALRDDELDEGEGMVVPQVKNIGMFFQVQTTFSKGGSGENAPNFESSSYGGLTGMDYALPTGTVLGFACATNGGTSEIENNGGRIEYSSIRSTFFMSQRFGRRWFMEFCGQLGRYDYDTKRNDGSGMRQVGSTDAWNYGAYIGGGYKIPLSIKHKLSVVPLFGMSYSHSKAESFSESSGTNFDSTQLDSLRLRFGGRLDWRVLLIGSKRTRLSFEATYECEVMDDSTDIKVNGEEVTSQAFSVDTLILSLSFSHPLIAGTSLFGGCFLDVGLNGELTNSFNLGIRTTF